MMAEIASIAEHISTTERNAADAEIDATQMKKLEFFQQQLAGRKPQMFSATVVDVRNYGLMVELPDALITALSMSHRSRTTFMCLSPPAPAHWQAITQKV
jgi:exoribonuclease R